MCGILLALRPSGHLSRGFEVAWKRLSESNAARGPDAQNCRTICVGTGCNKSLELRCFASELRLRGVSAVVQPHFEGGDVFCWNGEVFEGLDMGPSENDGVKLFDEIRKSGNGGDFEAGILEVLRNIEGPFAFTYYHDVTRRLYFGRDPLGRRSLLIRKPTADNPLLLLASVSYGYDPSYEFEELSTDHIYCLNVGALIYDSGKYTPPPFKTLPRAPASGQQAQFATPGDVNRSLPPNQPPLIENFDSVSQEISQPVDGLITQLSRSVQLRVRDIPYHGGRGKARVAVLFSGGIDSTVIAYLAHQHLPQDEPIDLLNVAFENPRKLQGQPDAGTARKAAKRKKQSNGKVDSEDNRPASYLVPDRVTGLEELEEFNRLCPNRQWNFVEIDVPFEESTKARPIVESLMSPSRTVMDMSLGLALYFASRGEGHVRTSAKGDRYPYKSTARVLLNGLGSDELLGGYGRHRTAFSTGGWQAVIDELQLEIDRIPTRNLGRDDRVISSHGKEVRHPFLSLSVVGFLACLLVHVKVDARLPLGMGDKMLLRLAAKKLGLDIASNRKKRAMQFGSHSARMEAGDGEKRGDNPLKSLD